MFIYCICTQYLVGAAFALITASIRRGTEVISLWHRWGGMKPRFLWQWPSAHLHFLVSCFSFSSWQYPIDSLCSGLESLLVSQAHQHHAHLEHFMLPSADQLFKDADFIFQQDLAPARVAKSTKSWLNEHGVGVLDWPANSPDMNPIENIWVFI